jgi:hypothetical protein
MISWYLGDYEIVIGNLFSKPMLPNINVFELGNERWQVLGEQSNGLLIIAVNNELVIELEPDILK